jgi:hypothetical protein
LNRENAATKRRLCMADRFLSGVFGLMFAAFAFRAIATAVICRDASAGSLPEPREWPRLYVQSGMTTRKLEEIWSFDRCEHGLYAWGSSVNAVGWTTAAAVCLLSALGALRHESRLFWIPAGVLVLGYAVLTARWIVGRRRLAADRREEIISR